jgi:hypothetical protein
MRIRGPVEAILTLLLLAGPAGATDLTAYGAQTQTLKGGYLAFAAANALAAVWADRLPAVQAQMQAANQIANAAGGAPVAAPAAAMVELAALTFGPTTILVSFLQSPVPGDCQSGLGLNVSNYAAACPLRVAVLDSAGNLAVVAALPQACFVQAMVNDPTQAAFDNSGVLAATKVTFDPSTYLLTLQSTDDGGDNEVCSQPPIQLSF